MKKQPTKTQREAKEIEVLCKDLIKLSKDWATKHPTTMCDDLLYVRSKIKEGVDFLTIYQ